MIKDGSDADSLRTIKCAHLSVRFLQARHSIFHNMLLSIIIPVFNEERLVGVTIIKELEAIFSNP
jgi:hypothetical protein